MPRTYPTSAEMKKEGGSIREHGSSFQRWLSSNQQAHAATSGVTDGKVLENEGATGGKATSGGGRDNGMNKRNPSPPVAHSCGLDRKVRRSVAPTSHR